MLEKAQMRQWQERGDVFDPGLEDTGTETENTMVEQ